VLSRSFESDDSTLPQPLAGGQGRQHRVPGGGAPAMIEVVSQSALASVQDLGRLEAFR
jgi:hypothetical protein